MYNKNAVIFGIRGERKVARLAKDQPNELMWVYKRFPEAELDNYVLYRLIPKSSYHHVVRKGGWQPLKKVDIPK